MAKAENIAFGIALVGIALIGAGALTGERVPSLTIILWVLGVLVIAVGFGMLLVVGAASLGRRGLRAVGMLATPVELAVPQSGWPGWRFTLEGVEHEVWVDTTSTTSRIVCDGRWADVTHSGNTTAFTVGRWPATLTGRVDWGMTAALLPLAIGAELLSGGHAGSESPPMRYDLRIDGRLVPEEGRLVVGRDGAPMPAPPRTTRAGTSGMPPEPDEDVVTFHGTPAQPGRPLRLDPPR
jgi:hypothetical protein